MRSSSPWSLSDARHITYALQQNIEEDKRLCALDPLFCKEKARAQGRVPSYYINSLFAAKQRLFTTTY